MTTKKAVRIWLVALDIAVAIAAYEVASVQNIWGLHTISHWANVYQWLGLSIFAGIEGIAAWWWLHFHEVHPQ